MDPSKQDDPSDVEIDINSITGSLCTVVAKRSWTISAVKASVAVTMGVPHYEQRLLAGTSVLQDTDCLSTVLPDMGQAVELTLVRIQKPKARHGCTSVLSNASEKTLRDPDRVLAAVQQCGYDLQWAPKFKSDKKIVLAAVEANGMALMYAAPALQADRDVVLAAVTRDAFALKFAAKSLAADRQVVLAALQCTGSHRDALRLAAEELRSDRDIVLAAVANHGYALEYAADPLRADRQILEVAVKQAGHRVLKYADAEVAATMHQDFARHG